MQTIKELLQNQTSEVVPFVPPPWDQVADVLQIDFAQDMDGGDHHVSGNLNRLVVINGPVHIDGDATYL